MRKVRPTCHLPVAAVAGVLRQALVDAERGLGARAVRATDAILADLATLCDGDLRRALNSLEVIVMGVAEGGELTAAELEVFARERRIRYDADEDEHHDTISAYIKSCRGNDPDAAMYWLAKMLAGGEDPRFIARRLVILASEDVGMADPLALPLATAAAQSLPPASTATPAALAHAASDMFALNIEMLPVIAKVGGTVDRVNDQLLKVDTMSDSAVDAVQSVDRAVRAVSYGVATPVQKAVGIVTDVGLFLDLLARNLEKSE